MVTIDQETQTGQHPKPHQPAPAPEREAGLLDLVGIVRRRKWLIAFGTLLGLGLAVLYFFQATPIYESSVEILVMQKDTKLPTRAMEDGEYAPADDLLSTHMQIFTSPRVIAHAVEKAGLDQLGCFAEDRREAEEKGQAFNPVGAIYRELKVARGGEGQARDARVLRATFRSISPQDCATVLQAIVASYQDFLGTTFQNTSSEAVELIDQAKRELADEVASAESSYQEFREMAPLFWEGERSANPHQDRIREIENQLTQIHVRRVQASTRLAVINKALSGNGADSYGIAEKLALIGPDDVARLGLILNATRNDQLGVEFFELGPARSQVAQTEYQNLLTLLLHERELTENLGPEHRDVQKVKRQIELTREYIQEKDLEVNEDERFDPNSLLLAATTLLQHDLLEYDQRERQLRELLQQEQAMAKQLIVHEVRNEMLRAELERKRALYDTTVTRLREINLIRDYGGFLTDVLSPIGIPSRPAAPKLLLVLALGGVLGVFFGSGLAYLAELTDRTFRGPHEVSRVLGLPLMADLPPLSTKKDKRNAEADDADIDQHVVAYHRPRSRAAETFRGLRTSLQFGIYKGQQKVIQITSPCAGDGKSTIAANLAVSLAQANKRVLIVDGDLRRPVIHKLFGLENHAGLSSVITEATEFGDAVQATAVENLWALTSGPIPPNPAELLSLSRFSELISMLREKYDMILVDTPPLLVVSDPSVIAPNVDGVLLATRIRKNGAPAVVQARSVLAGLGAQTLGVIINGFRRDRHYGSDRYGSGYGYGYGYRYGYGYGYGYGYDYGYGYGGYGGRYREETRKANGKYYTEDAVAK